LLGIAFGSAQPTDLAQYPAYRDGLIAQALKMPERHNQGAQDVRLLDSMLTAAGAV